MRFSRIVTVMLALLPLGLAMAQDAADAYRDARRALNRRDFDDAIAAFQNLRRDYPDSAYVGDSYYWEAFALQRNGDLGRSVEVIDVLLDRYGDAATADDARALRVQVCSDLARRGDGACAEAVSSTVRAAAELDETTRMAALNALLNMRADRAIPIALQVATNRAQPSAVRRQALFVLADKSGETDGSTAREALRSIALDRTDDGEIRAQAVFWLSEVPGEDTLDLLAEIVAAAESPTLTERAIFAISQHDDPRALELLRQYAQNDALDTSLRQLAIYWIAESGEGQSLPFLTDLFANLTDPELKRQVLYAVSETGASGAASWLVARARDRGAPIEERKQALFWAAQSGLPIAELSSLYESFDEPGLREHLIWLIADQGGPGSLDRLLDIAHNDPDAGMRQKAIFWIGDSDDPRAAESLLQLLGQ